jgi:peptide chain release factor subunit 3
MCACPCCAPGCEQEPISKAVCPWYDGKPLIQTLDELVIGGRNPDAPLRIPVLDKFVDRGTVR